MRADWWVLAVALTVIVAAVGGSLWWFVIRARPDEDELDDTHTYVLTDGGERCLTCGEFIDWDGDDGHCRCCADDHGPAAELNWGEHWGGPGEPGEEWQEPDETWVEQLPPALEFPPVHEHRELVPTALYVELSDDPDLLEWDTHQQRARIADIRTHLAMLGAREATWYADRMASVSERLAA